MDSGLLAVTGMGDSDRMEVAEWTVVGWQSQVLKMLMR